jgi:predicted RNase H-like HicB family nuclease
MLTEYIQRAMSHAHYELIENGHFFATIPKCKGLWAESKTLEQCREELQSTLEDWLLLGLQLGHNLPVIDRINLNRSNRRKAAHAQLNIGKCCGDCARLAGTGRIKKENIRSWSKVKCV